MLRTKWEKKSKWIKTVGEGDKYTMNRISMQEFFSFGGEQRLADVKGGMTREEG